MSIARRIQELEAAAYRQGYEELSRRMAERVRGKSDAEIKAISGALEEYMRNGRALPRLAEMIEELTQP